MAQVPVPVSEWYQQNKEDQILEKTYQILAPLANAKD